MKFDNWIFFAILLKKFSFHENLTIVTTTSHEYLCTYVIISLGTIFRSRNFSGQILEETTTLILCSLFFFRKLCTLRDIAENYNWARQVTGHNIMRCMRCACWVIKAIDTNSEYEILFAFQRGNNGYTNALQYYVIIHCWCCMGLLEAAILSAW